MPISYNSVYKLRNSGHIPSETQAAGTFSAVPLFTQDSPEPQVHSSIQLWHQGSGIIKDLGFEDTGEPGI